MRIDDLVYFAPDVRFDQVDLGGPDLPVLLGTRIVGFYLEPARGCIGRGEGFAAGVLLVSCIDALARFRFGRDMGIGDRIRKFAQEELKSFASNRLSAALYDQVRNGLVHEARLKAGAQFSLETGETLLELDGVLVINPLYLEQEVHAALDSYVSSLKSSPALLLGLRATLEADHKQDPLP